MTYFLVEKLRGAQLERGPQLEIIWYYKRVPKNKISYFMFRG